MIAQISSCNSLYFGLPFKSIYNHLQYMINKYKQMHPLSPKLALPEHEYNFKVKVNYHNGMVSVHGPATHSLNAGHSAFTPNLRAFPSPQPYATIPINISSLPNNIYSIPNTTHDKSLMATSPSFTTSNVSQANHHELQFTNLNKINSDKLPFNYNSEQKNNYVSHNIVMPEKDLHRTQSLNYEIQKQPSIDCVICERKFSSEQFAYHIQLHKNGNKKKQTVQNRMSLPTFAAPQIQQSVGYAKINNIKLDQKQNSMRHSDPNQFLYSFENKNNMSNSFQSQSKTNRQQTIQNVQPMQQHASPLQSVRSSQSSSHNLINGEPMIVAQLPHQIIHLSSGIRYPNQFQSLDTSRMSHEQSFRSNGVPSSTTPQIVNIRPLAQVRSSHGSHTSQQNKAVYTVTQPLPQNSQVIQIKSDQNLNHKPSNPFEIIEQNQSKIYEYFPQSGYLSLSQHKVSPNNENRLNFHNQIKLSKTVRNQSYSQNLGRQINQDANQIQSQCSDSSISSIRQMSEPLQRMGKPQLVKIFHANKNRLDLSNIIGMSETLAREGMSSNSAAKEWNNQRAKVGKSQTLNRKQKCLISKSVMYQNETQQEINSYNTNIIRDETVNRSGLQMIPIQGRQIYRGIQVNEEQLRGYDMLNATRSSKSSAKTKIPRNYLAVNDFISSNYGQ